MTAKKSGYADFFAKSGRKMHSVDRERPQGHRQPRQHAPPTNQRCVFSNLQPVNPVLLSSIAVPLILLITVINAATICVTLRNRRLRKLRNMPRTSLALADLMVGLLVGPMLVTAYLTAPNRTFCTSYLFLETFCYTSSLINILVVAIERSITVLKPLHYTRYLTSCFVWGMIACAWTLSILVPISLPEYRSKCRRCYCVQVSKRNKSVHSTFLGAVFIVFAMIMIVIQVKMYLVVKYHRRRISPSNFGHSVGELTTTRGAPEPSVSIQLDCLPAAEKGIERNNRMGVRVQTLALALLHVQNGAEDPAPITRYAMAEQYIEGEGETYQNSPSGEPNAHLSPNAKSASRFHGNVNSSRSQICTIYRGDESVLGVQIERDTRSSRFQRSTSIFKHTQFASFMYLAFILLWTPYLAILLMKNYGYLTKYYLTMTASTKLLVISNSLINPFVHTIRMKEFRKCAKAYFCRESHE